MANYQRVIDGDCRAGEDLFTVFDALLNGVFSSRTIADAVQYRALDRKLWG